MALRNGKHTTVKKNVKNEQSHGVGQTEMGNYDSKRTIKFSSWTQSSSEVIIILHSGRKLSEREVSVTFSDKEVKVGLTDGRKWSCCFNQLVDKSSSRFQIRKLKIHLFAKKKTPDIHWPTYEKVEDESLTPSLAASDSSTVLTNCFDMKKSLTKSKSVVSDGEFKKTPIIQPVEKTGQKNVPTRISSPRPTGLVGSGDEGFQNGISNELKTEPYGANVSVKTLDDLAPSEKPTGGDSNGDKTRAVELEVAQPTLSSASGSAEAIFDALPFASSEGQFTSMVSSHGDSVSATEAMEINDSAETDSSTSSTPASSSSSSSAEASFSQQDCELEVWGHGSTETLERSEETSPLLGIQEPESADPNALLGFSLNREVSSSIPLQPEFVSVPGDLINDKGTSGTPFSRDDVRDLMIVKNDMYEKDNVVVVTMFVKQIKAETLQVIFSESEMLTSFQTSDQKFLQSYEGSTSETVFRWKVNLISTIVCEKCFFRLSPMKLMITLTKKLVKKWGSLTALPMMRSMSMPQTTANAWMSTCPQNNAATTPADANVQKQPAAVVFDELNDPPAKSSKPSTSGYFTNKDCVDSRKDLSGPNKPTCKVSPITNVHGDSTVSSSTAATMPLPVVVARPGMMGLENLGNTCFMNSVLQVLANTAELKDYFLDGTYQKELNYDNPLGMEGKLASAFGYLMKVLWTSNQRSFEPSKLKNLVAAKQTRFVGYSQHDAEEFMEFLLDGLHEDLNRIHRKPYFQDQDLTDKPEETAANEAWKRHKMRNDSHIIDVFQGQYRSRVVCPTCDTVSITFDPFSIVQVPISKKKKLINTIFMSTIPSNKPMKYQIQIGVDATVDHLKDALYQRTRVHPSKLRILEVSQSKIVSEFTKGSSLEKVSSSDMLVACAVLTEADVGEPVHEFLVVQRTLLPRTVPHCCNYCHRENNRNVSLKRCTRCYKTSYCDQDCQRKDWSRHKLLCTLDGEPVGCPFVISIPNSKMTFSHLCSTIEAYARYSVNAFQPPPLARKTLSSRKSSSTSVSSLSSASSLSEPSKDGDAAEKSSSGDMYESTSEVQPGETATEKPDMPVAEEEEEEATDNASVTFASSEADSNLSQPPVRCVLATKQNMTPLPPPPFYLRPCTRQGIILHGTQRLQDQGEDLLDIFGYRSLLVEWKNKEDCNPYVEVETKSLDYEEAESNFKNGSSVDVNNGNVITLGDCLTLFTEPEILHPDQTWYCPKCKVHCQATKEMSLWRLPPTLIIHLKRFSFVGMLWRNKIDDLVDFPVRDLDMSPYVKRPLSENESPPIYDLYGVINHMGDLLGGHYTSFARCPDPEDTTRSQIGWRLFDDSAVKPCSESQVVTRSAYVLFYRRRDASLELMERNRRDVSLPVALSGNLDYPPAAVEGPATDDATLVITDDLDDVRMEDDEENELEDSCGNVIRIAEATTTTHVEETDIDSVD